MGSFVRWTAIALIVAVVSFFHFVPTTVFVSFDNKLASGFIKLSPRHE